MNLLCVHHSNRNIQVYRQLKNSGSLLSVYGKSRMDNGRDVFFERGSIVHAFT